MSQSTSKSQAPAGPTFTAFDVEPVEEPEAVAPPPFSPGYLMVAPAFGKPTVVVSWGEPADGPADGYEIKLSTGEDYTVSGDVFNLRVDNCAPGDLTVTVTGVKDDQRGSLTSGTVEVQAALPAQEA